MSYRKQFIKDIVDMSQGNDFTRAKLEWYLVELWKEQNHCLCGHFIIQSCLIKNDITGHEVVVGNCCVKKFLNNMSADEYFKILMRIEKNIETTIRECNFIKLLLVNNFINNWEYGFYMSIKDKKKSKLSPRQLYKKIHIHKKVLKRYEDHKKIKFEENMFKLESL